MQTEGTVGDDAYGLVRTSALGLTVEPPDLELPAVPAAPDVPVGDLGHEVEHLAVGGGPKERDVLRLGPCERRGRFGRSAELEMEARPVGLVPDLLGQPPGRGRELLHGPEVRAGVVAEGELVVPAFPGQDWPRAPLPPFGVRAPVLPVTVPVVVVPAPRRSERGIHLQYLVDHAHGVDDRRVVRCTNAESDEVEEPAVDDLRGGELLRSSGLEVRQSDRSHVRARSGDRVVDVGGTDPNVVAGDARNEGPGVRYRPALDMRLEEICELLDKLGGEGVPPGTRDDRRYRERGDAGRECRRRVAADLLPPVLLG